MRLRFISQPFEDGLDLRDYLQSVAENHQLTELVMVVAWAKRSGLSRAAESLRKIRNRGGRVRAVVGVSEGGATRQDLEMLMAEVDEAWVFHDVGRTFHPKVYFARGDEECHLLVGSHNLTGGGFAWNYETGLWCELDVRSESDAAIISDVVSYIDRLINDNAVCLPLTVDSLARIIDDPRVLIGDEVRKVGVPTSPVDGVVPEDSDAAEPVGNREGATAFGLSKERKRPLPAMPGRGPWKKPRNRPVPVTGAVVGSLPQSPTVRRWFKKMDATAAQQPKSASSNPTGNLRLSREEFPIDWTTYFVEEFFGDQDWRPHAKIEGMLETWVPMHVQVTGDYLGVVQLRISHNPARVSGQGNVPSVLHWGDLGARLRSNNYVGQYVSLERRRNGEFALVIAAEPTGPFEF